MEQVKCGNVFITEQGDFSFVCLNCSFVYWEFIEYRNHILDFHLSEYFCDEPNSKQYLKFDILEIISDDDKDNIKNNTKLFKSESKNISEILTIEKLHADEINEIESETEEDYYEYDEKCNLLDSDEFSGIKIDIADNDEESSEAVVCEICNEDFKNFECFDKHKTNCNSKICPFCSLQVSSNLAKHISMCFSKYEKRNVKESKSISDSDESSEIKIEISNNDEESSESVVCKLCNKEFKNIECFDKHKTNCNSKICSYCSIHISSNLAKHISTCRLNYEKKSVKERKSEGKSIAQKSVCNYCDRIFYVESALQKHKLIHETNSDKCDLCGKRFRTLDSLRNHIRRHKGERPFKCSECSCAFNDKINLKTHYIVKHTEGLKIPCEYKGCGRIFKTVELRKRHEKYVHNSEKNYLCLSCGMRFKTSSKLNEHTKKKHLDYEDRPFECELCKKKFIFLQDLKNHKMTHTGEKPFKCDFCTKAFIKRYELTKHFRRKHADTDASNTF